MRQSAIDELRPTLDDPDTLLVAKAEEHLDEEERTASGSFQQLEDLLIDIDPEQVGGDPRDGVIIQRADPDLSGAEAPKLVDRPCRRSRFAERAKRDHPGDREPGEPNGERAERRGRSAVHPMRVV